MIFLCLGGYTIFRKENLKMLKNTFLVLFISYIIYALFFSVFIFRIHEPKVFTHKDEYITNDFYPDKTNKQTDDKAVLLEDEVQAAIARIDMIEQAEKTIDIAYHTLHKDSATNTFLGLLVDAANRGVEVQVLFDGIFHNLRGELKHTIYSFADHPNITLKYYEPLDLFRPWTWNNRLHDKIIITDDKYAMIGGRNIGNKYFDKEGKTFANDRDVMIVNQDGNRHSVIHEMKSYFNELWTHQYSKVPVEQLTNRQQQKGQLKKEQLLDDLQQTRKTYDDLFNHSIHWDELAISTEQITLIHNPIQRCNKEPWIWLEIINLLAKAEESIVIESPYIIPTQKMMEYTGQINFPTKNITLITNSLKSTTNPLAFSGYLHHVDEINDNGFDLQEYTGPYSIHGKTYVIDEYISIIGSYNLDARSTFLSTESMVIIESKEFANHLHQMMERHITDDDQADGLMNSSDKRLTFTLKSFFVKALSYITYFYHHLL